MKRTRLFGWFFAIPLAVMASVIPTPAAEKGPADLRIAAVFTTPFDDKSFSDLIWKGIESAKAKYGLEGIEPVILADAATRGPELAALCASGDWDLVLAGTYSAKDAVERAAERFPDQKFLVYDMRLDFSGGRFQNCHAVIARQNEAAFLAGALSAMLLADQPKKLLGFVGGEDNDGINDFLVGYALGAKYVDPGFRVLSSYVGGFTDAGRARDLALGQYEQGAGIVFGAAAAATMGVFEAAKEADGLAIGVDQDQARLIEADDPAMAEHIVTSVRKNYDALLADRIGNFIDGDLEWGVNEFAGLAENGVCLADNRYYRALAPADIVAAVNDIRRKISAGEIKIATALEHPFR